MLRIQPVLEHLLHLRLPLTFQRELEGKQNQKLVFSTTKDDLLVEF